MKISISSPFPVDSLQGNSVSGRRIAGLLKEGGYTVEFYHNGFAPETDLFIALNAWRSSGVIGKFSQIRGNHPETGRKLIVVMTGSDLFPFDGILKEETLLSIQRADAIVITHGEAREKIDHPVVREIGKSIVLPKEIFRFEKPKEKSSPGFQGIIVAHLREQKNPFLYLRAIPYLKTPVRVVHYGNANSREFRESARKYRSDAYQWMGEIPRIDLLRGLHDSDFLLNTSYIEGSSNAIYESIALGTPVIASAIPGNIGVLGKDYPGLFRPNDAESLAATLDHFSGSGQFREDLQEHCKRLKSGFSPDSERQGWCKLIEEIR